MKTFAADKVTRTALVMIALGIWSLFLLQIRATIQPQTLSLAGEGRALNSSRYQMVRNGDSKMYLLDTQTGRVWASISSSSLSGDEFNEVGPTEKRYAQP